MFAEKVHTRGFNISLINPLNFFLYVYFYYYFYFLILPRSLRPVDRIGKKNCADAKSLLLSSLSFRASGYGDCVIHLHSQ